MLRHSSTQAAAGASTQLPCEWPRLFHREHQPTTTTTTHPTHPTHTHTLRHTRLDP